jgi:hypothetical protein
MDDKVRKVLGGMSVASLILVGSLPLMGQQAPPPPTFLPLPGGKAKSNTKQQAEKAKTKATPEKAKAAEPPDSGTNKEMNKTDRAPAKTTVKEKAAAKK